jgi:hypothetical protein
MKCPEMFMFLDTRDRVLLSSEIHPEQAMKAQKGSRGIALTFL